MTELTERSTARDVQTSKWKLRINEAGHGHPVILLHGSGPGATGWTNFSRNIEPLSRKYHVIALDSPGWGQSDPVDPTKESFGHALAESIKLLMDELGLDKAALVGNSGGGGAAMQFAVQWPERVSHLVTMGSGIPIPGSQIFAPAGLTEGLRILLETYRDPSPANFRRLVSIMVYDASFVTDELCQMRSDSALARPEHLANWGKRMGLNVIPGMPFSELASRLAAFEGPSLFIHGRDDRVVQMEMTLRLVSMVPNAQAHIFNRCGHWCQIEHAEAFNALIDAFLSSAH
jgi:2-hydroxy-6-oxonona-2,4-dienedioate hydrolase